MKRTSRYLTEFAATAGFAATILSVAVAAMTARAGPLELLIGVGAQAYVVCDQDACLTSPVSGAVLVNDLDVALGSLTPDLVPINAALAPNFMLTSVSATSSSTATRSSVTHSAHLKTIGSTVLSVQVFFYVTQNDFGLTSVGTPRTLTEDTASTWTNVPFERLTFFRNRLQSISYNDPANAPFGFTGFTTPFIEESPYSLVPVLGTFCTPFTGVLLSTCSDHEQTSNILEGNPFSLTQETLISLTGANGAELTFQATTAKSVAEPSTFLLLLIGAIAVCANKRARRTLWIATWRDAASIYSAGRSTHWKKINTGISNTAFT